MRNRYPSHSCAPDYLEKSQKLNQREEEGRSRIRQSSRFSQIGRRLCSFRTGKSRAKTSPWRCYERLVGHLGFVRSSGKRSCAGALLLLVIGANRR